MYKRILLATLAAAACGSAQAEPEFSVKGFGTLGATHSDNRDNDFRSNTLQNSGVGKTRAVDFGLDTMLGVQFEGKFDSHLSAVVQITSSRGPYDNFEPSVEWANLKYAFSPDFSVRLGRYGLPLYMVSDYRMVGYANPWARTPVEVYNQIPISHADGIDVSYRMPVGDAALTLQGDYTDASFIMPARYAAPFQTSKDYGKVHGMKSAQAVYEEDSLSLRAGYGVGKVELMPGIMQPAVDALNLVAGFGIPGAVGLLDGIFSRNAVVTFAGVGGTYDNGQLLLQAEYVQRRGTKGLTPDNDAAYVLAGYHFGTLMPFVICAKDKPKGPYANANADADADALVAAGRTYGSAGLVALGQGAQLAYAQRNVSQQTLSLGVRYDFMKDVAFKAQYDHIRPETGGRGGSYPEFTYKKTNILTLNFDFVF